MKKRIIPPGSGSSLIKYRIALAVLFMIAYAALFVTTRCKLVITEGPSMEPTFSPGDILLFTRSNKPPSPGEIVLLEHGGKLIVKRVAYIAGSEVQSDGWYDSDNTFTPSETMYWGSNIVPDGYVYLLGDNASNSHDSRYADFGLVPISKVWGTVAFCD